MVNKIFPRLHNVLDSYSECSAYDRMVKNKEYDLLVTEMQDYLYSNYLEWVKIVAENPQCRRDTIRNPLPLNLKYKRFRKEAENIIGVEKAKYNQRNNAMEAMMVMSMMDMMGENVNNSEKK